MPALSIGWFRTLRPRRPPKAAYFGMGVVTANGVNVGYTVGGAPASFNRTGVRGFCSNEDGVLRFTPALNGPPVTTDTACAVYEALR